jgi:TolB-like protein/predicted Ser/Thr protein kinase/Tfp pilus assembly protein PilF
MTTTSRFCRKCGATVPPDSPEESCGACLLEMALSSDEPVAGGVDPGRAPSMSMHFGDYELLEEIGRGGQGVVFRARQKSLNRTVALKVIRLGQWASKAHLKRFRLEAEAAAKLEHPGIVPIHEVGERDGSCYFSMKFVEGGQLDEVARREPMPIRRAVELIAKIARTVHYAQEHGILHRDIKPGNILLDAKGEPHLTDFGLARLLETESSVTQTLDVLGTPSYMAPEQAVGNNAAVSSATDVYGLGAVLYQLLTGQPPFAGGTTYETIKLLLDTEPRQPRQLNPKIDRDLSTICLKCLEKDPKRRYPSALELAEDLERWLKHEPIQARHTGVFARGGKWVRRNPNSALLAASLVALAAAAGWIVWKSEWMRQPLSKSIAVLPLENLSRDPDNAYFADGIQEEILTRLAGIADLKVISRTSTQLYQSKPRNLREIAKQLGVANILEGSLQKAGDHVRVNVQLINARTDSHLWADTYDRKVTDILGVESEIARGIAASLKAKLSGREDKALAVKPTNNPEAYEAYLRGLSFDERDPFSYSTDLKEKAAAFYERAVQLDPKFAVAWARLSRADTWISEYSPYPTTIARKEAAKRALDQAQKLAPDTPDTLFALAGYQYLMLRDIKAAKTTGERLSRMLPGSAEVRMYLGMAARNEGSWDQSVAYFEEALVMDPRNVQLLWEAARTYVVLRQFTAALKLFDRFLDIRPNDPDTIATKARIYQAQGNLQEAARLLSGINETSPVLLFETKVAQLLYERNYAELIRLQQARVNQDGFGWVAGLNLAIFQRLAGDKTGAKVTAEKVRSILEQPYREALEQSEREALEREERKDQTLANRLAWLSLLLSETYALIEEKDAALELAERAIMLKSRDGARDVVKLPMYEENLAWIQAMSGENSRAISALTHLLQTPYMGNYEPAPVTRALLRLDPMWDSLRSDPAFQKLCEEKQDLTTNGH